ncbi:hypothetical protein L0C25_18370 [Solicola gregarius]|uniref:Calcium-binding protein n=1 Tax=Solicola gregarius TaxID=2908642 RepID=A0AA46TM81_9ACTN|nr:hypothetical protein L0C25_18370 [Solicola gregarius]
MRTVDGDDRIRELFGTVDVDAGPGDDAIAFDYRDDSVRGNRLVGGAGADTFDLGGSFLGGDDPAGLVVDLDQGFVRARGTIDLLGFENVIGGWSASTLIGNDADNLLRGGPRTDTIEGRAGDDHLDGRDGADTGDGGTGDDTCTAFETVTACEN